eukprot:351108-Rhodomonas_salina.1
MLANVFGLISFIFFVFGILGVQLWGGFLQGKCYDVDIGYIHVEDENEVCEPCADAMRCDAHVSMRRAHACLVACSPHMCKYSCICSHA